MHIALTYDLKEDYLARGFAPEMAAEFDSLETINALAETIMRLGHAVTRIGNYAALADWLALGQRPDLVFNICEGEQGLGREARVPALLETVQIPFVFSDVAVLTLALHKGLSKLAVRGLGLATTDFYQVESLASLDRLIAGTVPLSFPLFVKPVAEGTSKGIDGLSRIDTADRLYQRCSELLERFRQPVLIERYLPGREFTVGIVGTGAKARVVGIMEIVFAHEDTASIYSYAAKFVDNSSWIRYQVPEPEICQTLSEAALKIWRGFGCRDGGRIDFREDEAGVLQFLEINPLAGLNPDYGDLPIICKLAGLNYDELVGAILASAIERLEEQHVLV
ncbi:MAG: D-alanine--D-alanine ligase [Clostridia bacterium]|nr:D-alanine--D-alanine ligase [Clostridia bacterium]